MTLDLFCLAGQVEYACNGCGREIEYIVFGSLVLMDVRCWKYDSG
jgi:DNA-directed RNA polymerase subunit RPC12/RpoP